jgi:hypothetical protein
MNKRCDYITPEGHAALATLEASECASPGDRLAVADRFGCRNDAAWSVGAAGRPGCAEHVGALLDPGRDQVLRPLERMAHAREWWSGIRARAGSSRAGMTEIVG